MLKSSIKSVEGWNIIIYTVAGMGVLYTLVTGNDLPSTDDMLKGAKSVQDIIAAYKGIQANMPETIQNLGITGGVLAFLYKVFSDFLSSRTTLKEKEMELKARTLTESKMPSNNQPLNAPNTNTGTITKKVVTGLFVFCTTCFLYGSVYAAQAEFSWLPNSEPDLAGYKVVWGDASRTYTQEYDCKKPDTSDDGRVHCVVPDVPETITYFAAIAYDAEGNTSEYSNEISVNFAPAAPVQFTIELPAGAVIKVTGE